MGSKMRKWGAARARGNGVDDAGGGGDGGRMKYKVQ